MRTEAEGERDWTPAGQWPLTARAAELRSAREALKSGGVVLSGRAGVGKTRLARELFATAHAAGIRARWIQGTATARDIPLGAFAGTVSGPASAWVVRQTIDELTADCPAGDVLVAVDDAHLLDDLSAVVVQQLVVHRLATVILTVREEHPAPDAVMCLWKDAHLARLDLAPLTATGMADLLVRALGGVLERQVPQQVWSLTQGNILFARQLVAAQLASGGLCQIDGRWRWLGKAKDIAVQELTGLIDRHLESAAADVLDILALAEPLDVSLLASLAGAAAVEEAETAGLITVREMGAALSAMLAHPLYGEARRAALSPARARKLRGSVAAALGGAPAPRPDVVLKRAVLSLDSDRTPDRSLLLLGSHFALMFCDMALTERLAAAAVAAGGGFESRFMLAYTATLRNAPHAPAALAELASPELSDEQSALVAVVRSGNLFWTQARPAAALAVLDEVENAVSAVVPTLLMSAMRSAFLATQGRSQEALTAGRAALACAEMPDIGVVFATWGVAIALGSRGQAGAVTELIDRGYQAAESSYTAGIMRFTLSAIHGFALRHAGLLEAARELAVARVAQAQGLSEHAVALATVILGQTRLYLGEVAPAVELLRDGLARMPFDRQGLGFLCLISLVRALALRGDAEGARAALERMEAARHAAIRYLDPEATLARACVCALEGDKAAAIALAWAAADDARRLGQQAHEVMALHMLVRFGAGAPAARLAELAALVDGPRAPAAALHGKALQDKDGDGLVVAAEQLWAFGDRISAADAFTQASQVLAAAGRIGDAMLATARAQRIARECGCVTTALMEAEAPVTFTDREREVALLAGAGLSNNEIADRLFLSARTVEGHLYRISAKLGGAGRRELARYFP